MNHNLSLFFLFFLMFKSMNFSLFYLVNYDLSPFKSLYSLAFSNFILFLDFLESFYFHNFILSFFFIFIVFPFLFFLQDLFFPDCSNLRIGNHFVHTLNFINMFIGIFCGSVIDQLTFLFSLFFEFIQGEFLFLLFL